MSEWESLEELDSVLAAPKSKRRRSGIPPATLTSTSATEESAAREKITNQENASLIPVQSIRHDNDVDEKKADSVSASAPNSSNVALSSTNSFASPSSSPDSELERLRVENARLRTELMETKSSTPHNGSSTFTRTESTLPSNSPILSERPKATIAFHQLSQHLRKHIDALMVNGDYDQSSTPSEYSTLDEFQSNTDVANRSIQYFNTFCLDRLGQPRIRGDMYQPLDHTLFDVPAYEGPINVVPLPIQYTDNGEMDIHQMLGSCFNCGQGHQLRDCPHPRDDSCIRMNSLLFREFVQGRSRADGSVLTEQNRRQSSGVAGFTQTRYYEDDRIKTAALDEKDANKNANADDEIEEGEIVLDDTEDHHTSAAAPTVSSSTSSSTPAVATTSSDASSKSGDYFMHSIHPSIRHPSASQLLSRLARSDVQVIDEDEDELLKPTKIESKSPSPSPSTKATPIKKEAPQSTPLKSTMIAPIPTTTIGDFSDSLRVAKRSRLSDSYSLSTPPSKYSQPPSAAMVTPRSEKGSAYSSNNSSQHSSYNNSYSHSHSRASSHAPPSSSPSPSYHHSHTPSSTNYRPPATPRRDEHPPANVASHTPQSQSSSYTPYEQRHTPWKTHQPQPQQPPPPPPPPPPQPSVLPQSQAQAYNYPPPPPPPPSFTSPVQAPPTSYPPMQQQAQQQQQQQYYNPIQPAQPSMPMSYDINHHAQAAPTPPPPPPPQMTYYQPTGQLQSQVPQPQPLPQPQPQPVYHSSFPPPPPMSYPPQQPVPTQYQPQSHPPQSQPSIPQSSWQYTSAQSSLPTQQPINTTQYPPPSQWQQQQQQPVQTYAYPQPPMQTTQPIVQQQSYGYPNPSLPPTQQQQQQAPQQYPGYY